MAVIEIIRNLGRRKLRSVLTISGIVIGIFALTTMGALSEHFNTLLDLGVRYSGTAVRVGPPDGQQTALLPISKTSELRRVDGVAAVYPSYSVEATPGGAGITFGAPNTITNWVPGGFARAGITMTMASGREIDGTVNGEVLLGAGIAGALKKSTGDTVDLPVKPADAKGGFLNHPFKVVGVYNPTGNGVDSIGFVSDADSRLLLKDSLPAPVQQSISVDQYAQGFSVYGPTGASIAELDAIAERINDQVEEVKATKPSVLVDSFKSTSTLFTGVITGAAVLALVIGGLSVVNTMIMAVTERVREIGLKKALGAHTSQLLREYLLEATVIGLMGGLAGYGLGVALTTAINLMGAANNNQMFLVTPRLTAAAIGFAVIMGALAGTIPAFRAARLDPVTALRANS